MNSFKLKKKGCIFHWGIKYGLLVGALHKLWSRCLWSCWIGRRVKLFLQLYLLLWMCSETTFNWCFASYFGCCESSLWICRFKITVLGIKDFSKKSVSFLAERYWAPHCFHWPQINWCCCSWRRRYRGFGWFWTATKNMVSKGPCDQQL